MKDIEKLNYIKGKLLEEYRSVSYLSGFTYLADMIFLANGNTVFDVMKMYEDVGFMYGKSYKSIERGIRHFKEVVGYNNTNKAFIIENIIKVGDFNE